MTDCQTEKVSLTCIANSTITPKLSHRRMLFAFLLKHPEGWNRFPLGFIKNNKKLKKLGYKFETFRKIWRNLVVRGEVYYDSTAKVWKLKDWVKIKRYIEEGNAEHCRQKAVRNGKAKD